MPGSDSGVQFEGAPTKLEEIMGVADALRKNEVGSTIHAWRLKWIDLAGNLPQAKPEMQKPIVKTVDEFKEKIARVWKNDARKDLVIENSQFKGLEQPLDSFVRLNFMFAVAYGAKAKRNPDWRSLQRIVPALARATLEQMSSTQKQVVTSSVLENSQANNHALEEIGEPTGWEKEAVDWLKDLPRPPLPSTTTKGTWNL